MVLHGRPGLSDYTESLLPELADSYTVVRFQQRGLATSTTAGPFEVEIQVAGTVSVLDGLGLDQALIIGDSWGGHLAMHLIAAHPGGCPPGDYLAQTSIDTLALLDPLPGSLSSEPGSPR